MNVTRPNLWQSILLFVLLVVIYGMLQIALYLFFSLIKKTSADILLIGTICSLIGFAVVIAVAVSWFETKLSAYLESAPVGLKIVIPLALMFIGLQIAISEFDNLMRYLVKPPQKYVEQLRSAITGSHPALLFISLVIIAPITEEIFFRGILLRGMLKNHSHKVALIASSVMFGLMHINPIMILPATVIGIFLGWIFILTRSLWCCFFCHAINNLVVFISVVFNLELKGYADFSGAAQEVAFQPLWLDVLGIVLLIVGVYFTKKIAKTYSVPTQPDSSTSISEPQPADSNSTAPPNDIDEQRPSSSEFSKQT